MNKVNPKNTIICPVKTETDLIISDVSIGLSKKELHVFI